MENSVYLGLSRQMALGRSMEVVANNIANVNTPGFRAQNTVFEEYITKGGDDDLSFVNDRGQYEVTTPGSIKPTNNPLDIALNGPGFLGVQNTAGDNVFTRAGDFTMDADGNLLTSAGYAVIDDGGAPINIPNGSTEIKIDEQGVISNQDGEIGKLKIVEFEDLQQMRPLGNNTYAADGAEREATNTTVKQAHLEGANVVAVKEMSKMIEISRSYQSTQRTIQGEHERLRGAIQKLTSVN